MQGAQRPDVLLRFDFSKPVAFEVRKTFKAVEGGEETIFVYNEKIEKQADLAGGAAKIKYDRTLIDMHIDGVAIRIRPTTTTTTENRSPRGEVRERTPVEQLDQLLELRLMRIGEILFPPGKIEFGTTWEVEAKATEEGMPAAKWQWKFEKFENGQVSGTFAFAESGIEQPIQASGKFAFAIADGWPTELAFKAINTHLLGDEERVPTYYLYSLKRT